MTYSNYEMSRKENLQKEEARVLEWGLTANGLEDFWGEE